MLALVADDEATNRILLKRLLTRWGYEVVVADNGRKALEILSQEGGPRLAVLDWLMPEVDGVDVCRMLSDRAEGHYIYTVLVTHKTETADLATALDAGADDFLRKPVDAVELRSRLGVAKRVLAYDARLAETTRLLRQYGQEMETLAEERAKQLVHADRMATLGMLAAGIAHEVNNPTTFISGNVQTIERFWKDVVRFIDPILQDLDEDTSRKLNFIMEEMPAAIAGIQNGVVRVAKIVRGLKDYARHERGERATTTLGDCVRRSVELCSFQLSKRSVAVRVEPGGEDIPVFVDAQQIEQVIVNLLVNAGDAMEDSNNPEVTMRIRSTEDRVLLEIRDNGPGIPQDFLERIWNPFFTTKPAGKGTGLGLPICKRIVEDHEGRLLVENLATGGACFTLDMPRHQAGGTT